MRFIESGVTKMENEKCCYDCVSCIQSNAPLEVGVQYICINPKGEHYIENSIDPRDKACEHFVGGVLDGK